MYSKAYLFLLLLIPLLACGQGEITNSQPLTLTPVFFFGRIYKHTPNFKPDIGKRSLAFAIELQRQTTGNKKWQFAYNYPQYGISISFLNFGNDRQLGNAFGIIPYIQIPLYTCNNFQIAGRAGGGIAWVTKRYDVVTNPDNDVISTHINNITSFALRIKGDLSPHSAIQAGAAMIHYSAGDARLPNLGINVPVVNIGYSYTFNPLKRSEYTPPPPEKEPAPRYIYFKNKIVVARFEGLESGGPSYSQYGIELGIGKYLAAWNKLSFNTDAFYNNLTYYYNINQELEKGNEISNSFGVTVNIEDEFLFNNAGIIVAMGYKLHSNYFGNHTFYQKAGALYHFFNWGEKRKRNLFAGIYLKTNWANAEHVEGALGIEW